MRNKNLLFIGLAVAAFVTFSCERAPEFSEVPRISYESVQFGFNPQGQDSLIISVNFEDGDGNLGITSEEAKSPPFHEATYISADPPHDSIYNIDNISSENLLKYGDGDTLPEYNCVSYRELVRKENNIPVLDENDQTIIDTVYVVPNPKGKNFIVQFFIKQDDGTFEEFDFERETCISANGTIGKLNSADHERPLQGTLSYFYRAFNLRRYFGNNIIKMSVQLIDKKENESNIIETPEFTLDQILIKE